MSKRPLGKTQQAMAPADHMRFGVWLQARLDNWLRSEIKGQETL